MLYDLSYDDVRRTYDSFGDKLQTLMKRRGIANHVLATRLGISSKQLVRLLCGRELPDYRVFVEVVMIFGIDPSYFFLKSLPVKGDCNDDVCD